MGIRVVDERDRSALVDVVKGRCAQPAIRQENQNADKVNRREIEERADLQAFARNAFEHFDDSLLARSNGGFPVAQDEAGSLVSGLALEFAFGQDEKRPTLLAKRSHCIVESLDVFSDALERLDLDQADGAVPMLDEKVRCVSAPVGEFHALRLMPNVCHRRTKRGAVDEVPLKRRLAFDGLRKESR